MGIIDHGKIVAENTPARLKAEIGSPTVEIRPAKPDALDAMAGVLERFAAPTRNETGTLTVPLPAGAQPGSRNTGLRTRRWTGTWPPCTRWAGWARQPR